MNHRESAGRDGNDEKERRRMKFFSELGIKVPKNKKAAMRLRAKLRKIDKRDGK